MMNLYRKLICWWFGHDPNFVTEGKNYVSCKRCDIWDIGYYDLVMPSRHEWLKEELKYWFYFRWIAIRFKSTSDPINDEEIPF